MDTEQLIVEVSESNLEDYVIFTKNLNQEPVQVTEPGTYTADCFIIAGDSAFRQGKNYGTTFGSSTGWYYSNKRYRFMPGTPDWVRKIIAEAGHYTGGGGKAYNPGKYFIFNKHLFRTKEAAQAEADWVLGGRRVGW